MSFPYSKEYLQGARDILYALAVVNPDRETIKNQFNDYAVLNNRLPPGLAEYFFAERREFRADFEKWRAVRQLMDYYSPESQIGKNCASEADAIRAKWPQFGKEFA